MKKIMTLFLIGAFLLGAAGMALAASATATYTVSATIPVATAVSITPFSVNSITNTFTAVTGSSLSFDPMSFNTTNQIFQPDHYFAINVGPGAGGAGATSATITYTEGANPNSGHGSGHGLGYKSTAVFAKEIGSTETIMSSHPKAKLIDMTGGVNITTTDTSGGTLRIYLGVELNPTAVGEPSGAEVFSAADSTGSYTGTLVISATVA